MSLAALDVSDWTKGKVVWVCLGLIAKVQGCGCSSLLVHLFIFSTNRSRRILKGVWHYTNLLIKSWDTIISDFNPAEIISLYLRSKSLQVTHYILVILGFFSLLTSWNPHWILVSTNRTLTWSKYVIPLLLCGVTFQERRVRSFPPPDQCQQGGRVTRETVSRRPYVQTPLEASIQPVPELLSFCFAMGQLVTANVQYLWPASFWSLEIIYFEVRAACVWNYRLAGHMRYNKYFLSGIFSKIRLEKVISPSFLALQSENHVEPC